ncbi:MAG: response regulator [Planctomycetes bacterium]|nr:response regulator [Planctomycetota bacterium]
MGSSPRILVIEDDSAIRRGIVDALSFDGYAVLESGDGESGLRMAIESECDLLLLDLILPGKRGLEVLGEVRRVRPTLPVIIITALGEEADRIRGLKLGADDYVVKPFSVKELLARVGAVLRRSPGRSAALTRIGLRDGHVNLSRMEICFDDGGRCELSEREMELLRYLAQNAGRAIAREEILAHVWRMDPKGVTTRTIDMHITRLREKLRDDSADPHVIRTVRGRGYMFGAEKVES